MAYTFPSSSKRSCINHQYSQIRKNLRVIGLEPPRQVTGRLIGSVEQQGLLENLWVHLGTDDEGKTTYGRDLAKERQY